MPTAKVFVFAPADNSGESHRMLEAAGCQIAFGKNAWLTPQGSNEEEMLEMAQGADALIGTSIRSTPITRRIMEASETLRIVAKYTIGVDDVDVDAATELGILVTHAPTEANWGGVAEGAVGMMLNLLKKFPQRDKSVKSGGWRRDDLMGTYVGARADGYVGITIGIVGLGRVGSRFAHLLSPWKARLIACDPYLPDERFAELGVERVDYDAILRQSDVLSFHVTLTPETRHMLSEAELRKMKPSAVIINTSRGAIVDEAALIQSLDEGVIAAASLDVMEEEPPHPGNPLLKMGDNVLLSPHMVSANQDSSSGHLGPGIAWATAAVLSALRGRVHDNVFNLDVIPRWLERFGERDLLG